MLTMDSIKVAIIIHYFLEITMCSSMIMIIKPHVRDGVK